MYYKLVNKFDVECLEECLEQGDILDGIISECKVKVIDTIRQTVNIFDEYYSASRHPESDLGGFLFFLPTLQDTKLFYNKILNYYNLDVAYAEVDEEIAISGSIIFRLQTFLLSSDYGLVIVYPE
jgi:hypothetical protein